jgi:hypothetical protein
MYSFAQRGDTVVYDEPLYGAYLKQTAAKEYHPDADLIMKSMECDAQKVLNNMCGPKPKPVAFFKNMTHHLLGLDKGFMKNGLNIILTRDPKEMLPSFDKVIPNPSLQDVGYKEHVELIEYLKVNDCNYVVLDSKKILLNPEGVLKQLCEKAGINFQESMLQWEKGARQEDGVWAKHWYNSIHDSTGYMPYKEKTTPFPEHLKELLEKCSVYYKQMDQLALI